MNDNAAEEILEPKYVAHAGAKPERTQMPPDHIGLLIVSVFMIVGGWWGLFLLVTNTIPRVGQRWLFFVLLQIAITGTMIPMMRYINVRFTPVDRELPGGGVIVRQAMWFGLFAVTCMWLQIPRVLTWSMAFFLAIILIVIEFFLRMRERQLEKDWADEFDT